MGPRLALVMTGGFAPLPCTNSKIRPGGAQRCISAHCRGAALENGRLPPHDDRPCFVHICGHTEMCPGI